MTPRAALLALVLCLPATADGQPAPPTVRPPVLHPVPPRGTGHIIETDPVAPVAKTVDGLVDDWAGVSTRFGGTTVYSAGELVYQDHIFDAYGAIRDEQATRVPFFDALAGPLPAAKRIEGLLRFAGFFAAANGGEAGSPFRFLFGDLSYGSAEHQDEADLLEVRVAAGDDIVWLLARTTTMLENGATALVVLVDAVPGSPVHEVPLGSGIHTARGDVALFLRGSEGIAVDLATGDTTPFPVASNAEGYTNAIEAAIPRDLFGAGPFLTLTLASGRFDPATGELIDLGVGARLANVAFRTEPFRMWFDREQALALHAGTIDPFFVEVDTERLAAGATETFRPGHGYHERIFVSTETISVEEGRNGLYQHYGLYVPSSYREEIGAPLVLYLHGSGDPVHSEPHVIPGLIHDLAEAHGRLFVAPSGRDPDLSMYVGASHLDILEALEDALSTLAVEEDRVYVSGYSMGGWGTLLFSTLYPDRFAAALDMAGPVNFVGDPTGLDLEDCEDLRIGDNDPCTLGRRSDDDPDEWDVRHLFENLRHVPTAIYQGALDANVPITNGLTAAETFAELGYRHRFYLFPQHEHFTLPGIDEFAEGARYLAPFRLDPNPRRVAYVRRMAFERHVEEGLEPPRGPPLPAEPLVFDPDGAYWVDGLEPADPENGEARIDATSLAIPEHPVSRELEMGGPTAPGQTGPYVMTGIAWRPDLATPPAGLANGFEVDLRGAIAVRLDLARMTIRSDRMIEGAVTTQYAAALHLAGSWTSPLAVTIDESPVPAVLDSGVLTVSLPAGTSTIRIIP